MTHLHFEFDVGPDETILVELDKRANVLLMDEENYANYTTGKPYRYFGGYPKHLPVYLKPPNAGRWHLAVDLGGYPGSVRAAAEVIPDPTDPEEPIDEGVVAGRGHDAS